MPVSQLLIPGICALAMMIMLGLDRHRWRVLYFELDQKSRERERQLLDQLLLKAGARSVGSSLQPVKPSVSPYPVVGDDDMDILSDRINEHVEAGLLGFGEAAQLARDVQYGERTREQVDKILFAKQKELYAGSVADVVD